MSTRLEKLQQFLAQDPNDSFTHYAIGLEYASMKDYAKAVEQLESLRERDPNYIPTYYQLADNYRQLEQKEDAMRIYKEGITRARSANDLHAMSELQAAMDELEDEM
jgi:tetratricopeptide (TPR) repeat protein